MTHNIDKPVKYYDTLSRLPVIAVFSVLALMRLMALAHGLQGPLDAAALLRLATDLTILMFLVLIVILTAVRLKPTRRGTTLGAKLATLAGTYLSLGLGALPPANLPPLLQIASIALILLGAALSFYTLSWLGRSFSLLPEARALVTSGPYAIIRHPLYLCEEVAIVGAALAVASWPAVGLIVAQWGCQLLRIRNEEATLTQAFPDAYAAYASRVPRLLPWKRPVPAASAELLVRLSPRSGFRR